MSLIDGTGKLTDTIGNGDRLRVQRSWMVNRVRKNSKRLTARPCEFR